MALKDITNGLDSNGGAPHPHAQLMSSLKAERHEKGSCCGVIFKHKETCFLLVQRM